MALQSCFCIVPAGVAQAGLIKRTPFFAGFISKNSKLDPKPTPTAVTGALQLWDRRHLLDFTFLWDELKPDESDVSVKFAFSPHFGSPTPDRLDDIWYVTTDVENGKDAHETAEAMKHRYHQDMAEQCLVGSKGLAIGKVTPADMDQYVKDNFASLFHNEELWQPPADWWSMGVVHLELAHVLQMLEAARRFMMTTSHKAELMNDMPDSITGLIKEYVEKLFERSGVLERHQGALKRLYSQVHIPVFNTCKYLSGVVPKDMKRKALQTMNDQLEAFVKPLMEEEERRRSARKKKKAGITSEEEAASSEGAEMEDLVDEDDTAPKKKKKGE